jgi:hypothetical protein
VKRSGTADLLLHGGRVPPWLWSAAGRRRPWPALPRRRRPNQTVIPNEMCRKVDPTRINADGTIARFPVITAAERVEAVSTMRDLSASNPQLLHAWTSGRL